MVTGTVEVVCCEEGIFCGIVDEGVVCGLGAVSCVPFGCIGAD